MLDWRGIVATSLVHAAAALGWPATVFPPTTYCLCAPFGPERAIVVEQVRQNRLSLFPTPTGSDRELVLSFTQTCAGERPGASAPVMIGDAPLASELAGKPLVACASVSAEGRVTRLTIRDGGGRSPEALRRIRRHVEGRRFLPAMLDGSAVATRVEVRLGA